MPEVPDQVDQDEVQEPQVKRKGGVLILLVAALVGIAGGTGLGSQLIGPSVGARLAAGGDGAADPEEGNGGGSGSLTVFDNMVVNPAESNGTRFLLLSVAADLGDMNDAEGLGDTDFELRDAMLRVLGSLTVEELSAMENRARIVAQLTLAIDRVLGSGTVRRLFLPQWVIQ